MAMPADVATSLHSELTELAESSADLDPVSGSVSLDLAMTSSPVAPDYPAGSSVTENATSVVVPPVSPVARVASCSSTPPTPQSRGSESSPGLHSDTVPVSVPPPPYSAQGHVSTGVSGSSGPPPVTEVHSDAVKLPPPPKKPLTPYMRFSKSIWQKVKAANQNFTVCEIGATIGRLWREMTDIDKQQYNDDFAHDKARYDGELQVYLKATGLQASDLVKAKVKKSKPVSVGKAASHSSSPCHGDIKPSVDTVNGADSVLGAYVNAANGLAAVGSTLPHFSQVWSSTAQDVVYNADQLLAEMASGGPSAGSGQAGVYQHGNGTGTTDGTGVLMATDTSSHVQLQPANTAAVYHDPAGGPQVASSSVSTATSQDPTAAAMTSWLWQQYTAAAAAAAASGGGSTSTDQFLSGAETTLQPSDAMTNGSVIVYHLSADGTSYAANAMPAQSGDLLEPGEVRLPVTTAQTNGVADQLAYSNTTNIGNDYPGSWVRQSTVDSEKQLLRGALVDKVREIQRLTRELEQAYALIHQLKQHNEFLHRQWGQQMHVTADTTQ